MAALAPVMGCEKMRVLVRCNTVAATGAEFLARRMLIRHFVQKAFVVAPAPAVRINGSSTSVKEPVAVRSAADSLQLVCGKLRSILVPMS